MVQCKQLFLGLLCQYMGDQRLPCSPIGGVANVCRPTSWAGPRPSRKSLNWASEESLTPGKMRLKRDEDTGYHGDGARCRCVDTRQQSLGLRRGVGARLLTFPRSCSCSCCRPWTPGWPAESSCSSSPPPGPSPCSSGSCCATSCLLLLHTE